MKTATYRIQDITTVVGGGTPSTGNDDYWNGSVPWISPADLTNYTDVFISHGEKNITELGQKESSTKLLPTGAVLLSSRAPIGYLVIANNPICTNQGFKSMICDEFKVHNLYLYYYIKQNIEYFKNYASGSTFPELSGNRLKKIKVTIFEDICIQHRIASILSAYDELIEKNNRKIAILQEQAQELYKEWFVRFRFPGHETAKFENGLPQGWKYTTVETLSEVLRRGISPVYDDDGNYTVISQKCIREKIMDTSESRKQCKEFIALLNLIDSDTVICSTGTGTLGRVGQVYGDYPNTTFDSHVTLVRAKNSVGKQYLFFTLSNMQVWFMNMGIGSTNQQELYRGTIKNAKVILPNDALMWKFDSFVEQIHREITTLGKKRDILIEQRDLLLPRLMSGKLEVN